MRASIIESLDFHTLATLLQKFLSIIANCKFVTERFCGILLLVSKWRVKCDQSEMGCKNLVHRLLAAKNILIFFAMFLDCLSLALSKGNWPFLVIHLYWIAPFVYFDFSGEKLLKAALFYWKKILQANILITINLKCEYMKGNRKQKLSDLCCLKCIANK